MRERALAARERQRDRFVKLRKNLLERADDDASESRLWRAGTGCGARHAATGLTARAHDRIMKVARPVESLSVALLPRRFSIGPGLELLVVTSDTVTK